MVALLSGVKATVDADPEKIVAVNVPVEGKYDNGVVVLSIYKVFVVAVIVLENGI